VNDPRERASNPAETLDTLAALLRQRLEGTTDDGDGSRARAAAETQVGAVAPDAAEVTGDGGSPLGVPGYEGAVTVGRGPFATVYAARQRASDRTVAIKVYSALSVVERSWRRFRHECQQIASLAGHPGIWPVHDAGLTDQGRPYVTMDYAARGSLAERLRAGGPLRWQHGIEVGSRLADALEAAHDLGVRHGSIKPENVLFTPSGDPALADFGATTVPEGSAIAPALLAARRPHAAPEVLDGRPRQPASDIYALGSCLFTALAGEPPFSRPSDAPLPTVVAGSDHHTVPDLRPRDVPDAVCRALERALAHDPGDRHPTAADLRDDLRRAAGADASPEFDHSTPPQRGGVFKL
jgi:serine/threonine-protein kinase PknK